MDLQMRDEPPSSNHGAVVSVRGSVVDVRFERLLPPIFSVLRAGAGERSSSKSWHSLMPAGYGESP